MGAPKINTEHILQKLDSLPSLPGVINELNKTIQDPMASVSEVENIVAKDVGLTTKLLSLANSAYYAVPGGVKTLSRAIQYVGLDTIHQLALSSSIVGALKTKSTQEFNIVEFWKHSIGVGVASEAIARFFKLSNPSECFTCGMIHDIGKLALYVIDPESFLAIAREAQKLNKSTYEIETDWGITNHADIGALLCQKWKLPESFYLSVKYHHVDNLISRLDVKPEQHKTIDTVAYANHLTHSLNFGSSGYSVVFTLSDEVKGRLFGDNKEDELKVVEKIKAAHHNSSDFIKLISQ